jgi:hypothetical protein
LQGLKIIKLAPSIRRTSFAACQNPKYQMDTGREAMHTKFKVLGLIVVATVAISVVAYLFFSDRADETTTHAVSAIADSSAALTSPESLSDGEFPDDIMSLPANDLEKRIDEYNAHQLASCGKETIDECEGASKLRINEKAATTTYIVVTKTVVTEAHTDGVDFGKESSEQFIFKKGPTLEKVATLPGDVYLLVGNRLALSMGSTDTCAGHEIDGQLKVFDLEKREEVYKHDINDDEGSLLDAEFSDESEENAAVVLISTHSQTEVPGTEGNDYPVGDRPMHDIKRVVELRCHNDGSNCNVKQVSKEQTEGREQVGGCD